MSITVNFEIVYGDRTARCAIEVPFPASSTINTTNGDYQRVRKRILDFTSSTLASVIEEPTTAAGSDPDVAIKIEDEENVNPKKRKFEPTKQTHPSAEPVRVNDSQDIDIAVILRDNSTELDFTMRPHRKVKKALKVFAERINVPVQVLRMVYQGQRLDGSETVGQVSHAFSELSMIADSCLLARYRRRR